MCFVWRVLRKKICPDTQRKTRIRPHFFCKNVLIIDVPCRFITKYLSFAIEIFHKSTEFIIRNEKKLFVRSSNYVHFAKFPKMALFFTSQKNLIQLVLKMH